MTPGAVGNQLEQPDGLAELGKGRRTNKDWHRRAEPRLRTSSMLPQMPQNPLASSHQFQLTHGFDEHQARRSKHDIQIYNRLEDQEVPETFTPPMFHYVSVIKKNRYNIKPVNCSVN